MEHSAKGNPAFADAGTYANEERNELVSRLAAPEEQETNRANMELKRRFYQGDRQQDDADAIDIPQFYQSES